MLQSWQGTKCLQFANKRTRWTEGHYLLHRALQGWSLLCFLVPSSLQHGPARLPKFSSISDRAPEINKEKRNYKASLTRIMHRSLSSPYCKWLVSAVLYEAMLRSLLSIIRQQNWCLIGASEQFTANWGPSRTKIANVANGLHGCQFACFPESQKWGKYVQENITREPTSPCSAKLLDMLPSSLVATISSTTSKAAGHTAQLCHLPTLCMLLFQD